MEICQELVSWRFLLIMQWGLCFRYAALYFRSVDSLSGLQFRQTLFPLWIGQTVVLFNQTGGQPINASPTNVLDLTLKAKCDILFVAPAFLKIWSSQTESVEKLKNIPNVVRSNVYL